MLRATCTTVIVLISIVDLLSAQQGAPPADRDHYKRARLLTPADLQYLGAFAVPDSANPPAWDEWAYGGHALTYHPAGDPTGSGDGFPGSLYVAGNAQHDAVGEISIPAPVITNSFDALPRAGEL